MYERRHGIIDLDYVTAVWATPVLITGGEYDGKWAWPCPAAEVAQAIVLMLPPPYARTEDDYWNEA